MRVMLFGSTGMVGQGILRECLTSDAVKSVVCVGRTSSGVVHERAREIISTETEDFSSFANEFREIDACIFAIGVSITTAGPELFEKINCRMPVAVATALSNANPDASFVYISADGVDPTEKSSVLWKRLRGRTEIQLRDIEIKGLSIFRPLIILPSHGEKSRTRAYRFIYSAFGPLMRPFQKIFPQYITTSEKLARSLLIAAQSSQINQILDSREINRLGK